MSQITTILKKHTKLLKEVPNELAQTLTTIFNHFILSGKVPKDGVKRILSQFSKRAVIMIIIG